MTEIKDRYVDWWEHVAAVRRMVVELSPEDREQGARLNWRYWALWAAEREISGEQAIASEEYRESVVEALEGLRAETGASFDAWRDEHGIPDLASRARKPV